MPTNRPEPDSLSIVPGVTPEELLHGLGHQLGAQLRHAIGFSQLLQGDLNDRLSEDEREWLTVVSDSARAAQAMMEALRELIRTAQPVLREIDIPALAEAVGATLVCAPESPVPRVLADSQQIARAIAALQDNAERYGGGVAASELVMQPDRLELTVADQHATLTDDVFSIACGLFARPGQHPSAEHPGTGLTYARAAALAHCGTLTLKSPGCVVLTLPRHHG